MAACGKGIPVVRAQFETTKQLLTDNNEHGLIAEFILEQSVSAPDYPDQADQGMMYIGGKGRAGGNFAAIDPLILPEDVRKYLGFLLEINEQDFMEIRVVYYDTVIWNEEVGGLSYRLYQDGHIAEALEVWDQHPPQPPRDFFGAATQSSLALLRSVKGLEYYQVFTQYPGSHPMEAVDDTTPRQVRLHRYRGGRDEEYYLAGDKELARAVFNKDTDTWFLPVIVYLEKFSAGIEQRFIRHDMLEVVLFKLEQQKP